MTSNYKNIKPLVIGIGIAGKRHLEAQLNLGIKTGIYTTNPQTSDSLNGQDNIIIFDNLDDGIEWSNLVHICTPDDKHTQFVAAALKKRKAVLCEKSFTTNLKDALYLQSLARKYNAILIVGQNYRLTPTFVEIKKRVLKGQLGNITRIETTYLHDMTEYQKRYADKYFLYIGGSHAIDLACWISGEKVVSIKAFSKNKLSYRIAAKFSSGIEGHIILDANSPQSKNGTDLILEGNNGILISHNKSDRLIYKRGDKPQSIKLPNSQTFTIPQEVKIVDNYLSGKITSHYPLPNVDEAVNIIKVLDAVQKSVLSSKEELISY